MTAYAKFLASKQQLAGSFGFEPLWMPDFLFDFQAFLVDWQIRHGRGAQFADCGLGKSPMQLVWSENVVRHANKPVLLLTPIAVGYQMEREAEKFGVEAHRSPDGKVRSGARVVIGNYERLHLFDRNDFAGVACDESSILKNFDGVTKAEVTEFMRLMKFRALFTATAAPNDYVELGTSSEALGHLGFMDMLGRFFKTADGSGLAHGGAGNIFHAPGKKGSEGGGKFRFRGHAERDFWRWVCSWARAIRRPSDLGFEDGRFELPPMEMVQHMVEAETLPDGWLFPVQAYTLAEQRDERKRTLKERCEKVAEIVSAHDDASVSWCALNAEGDLLEKLIPHCQQVSGADSDERKDEIFRAFEMGQLRRIVTKPDIAGFGMNWQHCAHQTCFPSHSYEQLYQQIRRSWRFGQTKPVRIDVVTSEGEARVLANLKRKGEAADKLFAHLVALMGEELNVRRTTELPNKPTLPAWLS